MARFIDGDGRYRRRRDYDAANDFGVGFEIQSVIGSDARYMHFLGELDMRCATARSSTCSRLSRP
jgi:hypothetical protein